MYAIYQRPNTIDRLTRFINLQAMPGDTIFTSDMKIEYLLHSI